MADEKTVDSEDFKVDVDKVLKAAMDKGLSIVAVCGVDPDGKTFVSGSRGTPETIKLLNDGLKFIDENATDKVGTHRAGEVVEDRTNS